jgi:hypothetical protein
LIIPAVVHDQLAAMREELLQIRVHGELQNRLNSGDFLDFDTLPGCSTSSSFSFI